MSGIFPRHWAIGAVALSVLIACSPKTPEPAAPSEPLVEPPAAETMPAKVLPGTVTTPPPPVDEPGYSGVWAPASADCIETKKTYALTGSALTLNPQSRTCSVKSLQEEHPTGRSMIYHITAACITDPSTGTAPAGEDSVTLTFGASDTVMKMKVNADPDLTLERCPAAPTP